MKERSQDLGNNDPCILFALARERKPFLRQFPASIILSRTPELHRLVGPDGRSVCCLLTGVGERRMRSAVEWLFREPVVDRCPYRPQLVVSAGFSGALHESLRVGDLVVGTEVVHEAGGRWPASSLAECSGLVYQRGVLLTSARFVTAPEEKRDLSQRHGALAVDMESGVVAQLCQQHDIPFACLRVISDDVHKPLTPHLDKIVDDGRVAPWALAKKLIRSPGFAVELWRLGRQTRFAARRLAEALAASLNTMAK